jgi:uncharacterized protein (DUF305 family)
MIRTTLISLSSALAVTAAVAQQPASKPAMDPAMHMKMMQPTASDSASTKGYKESMMGMIQAMPMTFTGDADIDFMMQMKGHHQGAIAMAKVELANGKDPQAKKLATEIVAAQEKEIAMIDTWLKSKGK